MHIKKVLNYHLMGNSVKSFAEINQGNKNSMGILQVEMFMNKLQEFDQVMATLDIVNTIQM